MSDYPQIITKKKKKKRTIKIQWQRCRAAFFKISSQEHCLNNKEKTSLCYLWVSEKVLPPLGFNKFKINHVKITGLGFSAPSIPPLNSSTIDLIILKSSPILVLWFITLGLKPYNGNLCWKGLFARPLLRVKQISETWIGPMALGMDWKFKGCQDLCKIFAEWRKTLH